MNPKDRIISCVESAKADLDRALSELARLPAPDPAHVRHRAHMLGNHLTIIDGCVQLLMMTLKDHPDSDVHNWLEGIQRTTDWMTHTLRQLTNAALTGDVPLQKEAADLNLLVRRACEYYQSIADRKRIRVDCAFETEHAWVLMDRLAVAVVLDNLLSNAVKYSEPGKQVTADVRSGPEYYVCSVRDAGPGLSAQDQAKLFQRGVRLSSIPTAGEPSSGYGLAIAKEIIDRLHGQIWCESSLGQGASFSFRLPAARPEEHTITAQPPECSAP